MRAMKAWPPRGDTRPHPRPAEFYLASSSHLCRKQFDACDSEQQKYLGSLRLCTQLDISPFSLCASDMATTYGMPFLLEDKTGKLTGTDFVDINDRLHLRLRCTAQASTHAAYMVLKVTHGSASSNPLVALVFGTDNSLGTITFGSGVSMAMKQYLTKLSPLGSTKTRKFLGSDGQEYRWSWRSTKGHEWTCTNANQYLVASYSLKVSGEPDYCGSSGCMLTIDEAYPHLAAEMLASLTIMRHIVAHNL